MKNSSDSSIDDEPFEDQDQDAGQNEQNQATIAGNTLPMANGARSVNEIRCQTQKQNCI